MNMHVSHSAIAARAGVDNRHIKSPLELNELKWKKISSPANNKSKTDATTTGVMSPLQVQQFIARNNNNSSTSNNAASTPTNTHTNNSSTTNNNSAGTPNNNIASVPIPGLPNLTLPMIVSMSNHQMATLAPHVQQRILMIKQQLAMQNQMRVLGGPHAMAMVQSAFTALRNNQQVTSLTYLIIAFLLFS